MTNKAREIIYEPPRLEVVELGAARPLLTNSLSERERYGNGGDPLEEG